MADIDDSDNALQVLVDDTKGADPPRSQMGEFAAEVLSCVWIGPDLIERGAQERAFAWRQRPEISRGATADLEWGHL